MLGGPNLGPELCTVYCPAYHPHPARISIHPIQSTFSTTVLHLPLTFQPFCIISFPTKDTKGMLRLDWNWEKVDPSLSLLEPAIKRQGYTSGLKFSTSNVFQGWETQIRNVLPSNITILTLGLRSPQNFWTVTSWVKMRIQAYWPHGISPFSWRKKIKVGQIYLIFQLEVLYYEIWMDVALWY